jgi:hypothetical protein
MSCQHPIFHVQSLEQAEDLYRRRLRRQPEDAVARRSLAWCLFVRAIHESGRESARAQATLAAAPETEEAPEHLLLESLRQALTVVHLSPNPGQRRDAEQIRTLVRLSGAARAVAQAEADLLHRLRAFADELVLANPSALGAPPRGSGTT